MFRKLPLLTAVMLLFTGCTAQSPQEVQMDVFAMDTYMDLRVSAPDGNALLREASARITELEKTLSVTQPDSDISRINAAGGSPVPVSSDTAAILREALDIGAESGGSLDITIYPLLRAWGFTTDTQQVPSGEEITSLLPAVDASAISLDGDTVTIPADAMLDVGALAKGYTSDAVISLFRENGAVSAIISLGGNVQTLGTKPDGSLWTVGITDPFAPSEILGTLKVGECAVITSGNYERWFEEDGVRYWHILDPADGCPADNGLVSVTVVGESGLTCDALSTALFIEGTDKAAEHWRRRDDFEMLCVTEDGKILLTEGLEDCFTKQSDMPVEVLRRE